MVSHMVSRTVALPQKSLHLDIHVCVCSSQGTQWAVAAMAAKERETVLVSNICRSTRRAEAHISQKRKIMLDACP